jgi:hypothetical protein
MSSNDIEPTREWLSVGSAYNTTKAQRNLVNAAIAKLEWQAVEVAGKLPFSQGFAIQAAIKQFRIPKVSHVAYNGVMNLGEDAVYGVYGVEGHYSNARVRAYILDRGTDVLVVATDVWATDKAT